MKYKYKLSVMIIIFLILGIILSCACFALNLIKLIRNNQEAISLTTYQYITIGLCLILPVIFITLIIAAFVNSKYAISDKFLTINWGFLREKYSLNEIVSIEKNNAANKLAIKFKDGSYLNVLIAFNEYENFADSLTEKNKKIVYLESSEKADDNDKNK